VREGTRVGDLFEEYARRFPRLGAMARSLCWGVNQEVVEREQVLKEHDEVAFLPPVSGGSGEREGLRWRQVVEDPEGHFFGLTREPIDGRELVNRLVRSEDGAVVTFEGVARNHSRGRRTLGLEYDCYEPMAIKVMARVGREIAAAHEIGRLGMVHRLGRLEIGETSVVIVVTAAHREAAFAACREAIDRLKRVAPIWKKEYFEDGAEWVEGAWDASAGKS
jgi:molybdopterin synthase catalytic subunit